MIWENLLAYSLAKPGAWQDEPWEGDVVAKVGSKIFAFFGSGSPPSVGLKCGANRDGADEWLARYPGDASVMAYIGRSGWNTLRIDGAIPADELTEAIDASYSAVVSKLPKKDRPAQDLSALFRRLPSADVFPGRSRAAERRVVNDTTRTSDPGTAIQVEEMGLLVREGKA